MTLSIATAPDLAQWAGVVRTRPHAAPHKLPRTLVVTGHYPPQHGGVQRFTSEFVARLPADRIGVLAPDGSGADRLDADSPFPVHRYLGRIVNNPMFLARLTSVIRDGEFEAVWFTSGIPLGAAAPTARRAGVRRTVVSTHGLESGWSRMPVVRSIIRRASSAADVVTVLGEHTGSAIAPAVSPRAALMRLHGGVDNQRFHPGVDPGPVVERHGLRDRPAVVTVGRLVPRKGQATLLRAWPAVLRRHPDAVVMLVGEGLQEGRLRRLAARLGIAESVVFAGAVEDPLLPAYFRAAQVYALPCRTLVGGMALEGLGLTTLEASASGLPVVVGDSGGAGDALLPDRTGYLVDTSRRRSDGGAAALAERIVHLLDHPAQAAEMGRLGRAWVSDRWNWDRMTGALVDMLSP